jgi:hypothetical protein
MRNLQELEFARQDAGATANGAVEDGVVQPGADVDVSAAASHVRPTCSGECGCGGKEADLACQGEVIHRGSHWTAYAKECIGCPRLEGGRIE